MWIMGELAGEGLGDPGVSLGSWGILGYLWDPWLSVGFWGIMGGPATKTKFYLFIFFGSGASIHKDGESQRLPCAGFFYGYEIWSSVK